VTGIDPTGSVREGTAVTVSVAVSAPVKPVKPFEHGHGHEPKKHGD
jgi:hypothetical protein